MVTSMKKMYAGDRLQELVFHPDTCRSTSQRCNVADEQRLASAIPIELMTLYNKRLDPAP